MIAVYIMTNVKKTTLYTGSTINLDKRVMQHRMKVNPKSFTARYNISVLVYYRECSSLKEARIRERYIKGKSRQWKEDLISAENPKWLDLSSQKSHFL